MSKKPITKTRRIITSLGGTKKAAEFFGESEQAVSNWLARDKFPTEKYLTQKALLESENIEAEDAIWFPKSEVAQ